MASVSVLKYAVSTVAADVAKRYLIRAVSQSVRNDAGGTGTSIITAATVNGVTGNLFSVFIGAANQSENVSHYVPPEGILCDLNTAITMTRGGTPTSFSHNLLYQEVILT